MFTHHPWAWKLEDGYFIGPRKSVSMCMLVAQNAFQILNCFQDDFYLKGNLWGLSRPCGMSAQCAASAAHQPIFNGFKTCAVVESPRKGGVNGPTVFSIFFVYFLSVGPRKRFFLKLKKPKNRRSWEGQKLSPPPKKERGIQPRGVWGKE